MKLTNHTQDNYYDLNAVMKGTITMTRAELLKAYTYLYKRYQKAVKDCITYERDSLHGAVREMLRAISARVSLFSIGVYGTKLIADKHKLPNYRDQNYGIKIK